jgi:hypothetical protein
MSLDAWLPTIEALRDEGTVVVLKWDGERSRNRCTVVLTRVGHEDYWRKDGDDIEALLQELVADYRAKFPAQR